MAGLCFSLGQVEALLIWAIVVVAVVMIIRVIVPWLLSLVGGADHRVMQVINIVLWAIVVIAVIKIAFSLLSCLFR
jgi:cell shape-determining protein MreD